MRRFTSIVALSTTILLPTVVSAQRVSDPCTERSHCELELACVQGNCLDDGKFLVTLSWPANTDLDLVLQTPSGAKISAALDANLDADGGYLRRDECYRESDCEDNTGHLNVEHITWPWGNAIPEGEFEVWAVNYDGRAATNFEISVLRPDGTTESFGGGMAATERTESGHFTFTVKDTVCDVDSDKDGLCDKWEREGIDINDDGVVDLDLPALGADPNHKDLFVELDRLKDQKVFGLGGVVTAFANAPVDNPDGKNGITLHIEQSDEVDKYGSTTVTASTVFNHTDIAVVKYGTAAEEEESHSCDTGWFGHAADRASDNCEHIMKARKQVYRYALYVSAISIGGYSGLGELAGNDFIVSVGSWANNSQSIQQGTFMHELGHTLRLGHGGGDHRHCKPNHLSRMNYLYQLGDRCAGCALSYGPPLAALDEAALDEAIGIGGPASWPQVAFANSMGVTLTTTDASKPIDWNGDGDSVDTVNASVSSGSHPCGAALSPETLQTIDEWNALQLNFRTAGGWNAVFPAADFGTEEEELTEEDYVDGASSSHSDNDGLSNLEDNCPTVDNLDQADRDGDDVGDVCDECPDTPAPGYINGCPETDDGFSNTDDGKEDAEGDEEDAQSGTEGGVELPDRRDDSDDEDTQFIQPDRGCSTASGADATASLLLLGFLGLRRRRRRD